jgi:hypothetical protein
MRNANFQLVPNRERQESGSEEVSTSGLTGESLIQVVPDGLQLRLVILHVEFRQWLAVHIEFLERVQHSIELLYRIVIVQIER